MRGTNQSFAIKSALFLAVSIGCSQNAWAQSIIGKKPFDDCPLTSPLRISAAQTISDYESLGACKGSVIATAPDTVPTLPDVVRIIGVKETAADRKRREREEERQQRQEQAPETTAYRGTTGMPLYDDQVVRVAANYKIDPLFLHAIIGTESAYRPRAVSRANAIGLMQIVPATGRTLGVEKAALFDPGTNIDAGARLLKRLQRRYGRDFDLILAGYNAGEGAVARYGNRVPPYAETQGYVRKVMQRYETLRAGGGTAR